MVKQKFALEMKGVYKSYRDGDHMQPVLQDLNLTVSDGELVAVVGPSGLGKSTFLTIAGALQGADEGTVAVNGIQISGISQKGLTEVRRHQIGFIFQNHQLLPYLNAVDQLTAVQKLVGHRDEAAAKSLLTDLGLGDSLNKFPDQMSGGERQRTAIARAFINHPDLILADEPTASLDGARGYQVVEMIRREVKRFNKAGVIVTHDERVLDLMDRIFYLEDGRLVEKGA